MNEEEKDTVTQLIGLMAHVEGACDELGFTPPVEVLATDAEGQTWEFDYSSTCDLVGLLHLTPKMPITLRLQDSNGSCVERQIADLTSRPEWEKRFLQ
jgi:hypothetical protein